jgi:hypothetical protein
MQGNEANIGDKKCYELVIGKRDGNTSHGKPNNSITKNIIKKDEYVDFNHMAKIGTGGSGLPQRR